MMIARPSSQPPQKYDRLNQAALRWLRAAGESPPRQWSDLFQLLELGFARNLPIPGLGQGYRWDLKQAFYQLLAPRLDPTKVLRWFLSNPNAPSPQEVESTLTRQLEDAKTWEDAAQSLLEAFYDRMMAENDYYQSPASEPSEGSASE